MLLALFLICSAHEASAFYVRVHGLVTEYFTGNGMKGVQIRLVKDSVERETVITNGRGEYEIYLERGYDYLVWYHRQDLVTKHVHIDAREIPLFPDVPFYDMDIQMTMFSWVDKFDLSIFDKPVGRSEYKHSVRNLSWDVEYTERMRPELAKVMILYERDMVARAKAAAIEGTSLRRKKSKRKMVNF